MILFGVKNIKIMSTVTATVHQRWFALKNEGEHIRQYENEVQSKIRAVLLTFTELRKKITAITVSGQNQLLLGISKTVTISVVDSEKKYVSLRNKY